MAPTYVANIAKKGDHDLKEIIYKLYESALVQCAKGFTGSAALQMNPCAL